MGSSRQEHWSGLPSPSPWSNKGPGDTDADGLGTILCELLPATMPRAKLCPQASASMTYMHIGHNECPCHKKIKGPPLPWHTWPFLVCDTSSPTPCTLRIHQHDFPACWNPLSTSLGHSLSVSQTPNCASRLSTNLPSSMSPPSSPWHEWVLLRALLHLSVRLGSSRHTISSPGFTSMRLLSSSTWSTRCRYRDESVKWESESHMVHRHQRTGGERAEWLCTGGPLAKASAAAGSCVPHCLSWVHESTAPPELNFIYSHRKVSLFS